MILEGNTPILRKCTLEHLWERGHDVFNLLSKDSGKKVKHVCVCVCVKRACIQTSKSEWK